MLYLIPQNTWTIFPQALRYILPTLFTLKTILRDGVYLPVLHDPGCAATQISISLFHKEATKSCYMFVFGPNHFIYTKKCL